MILSKIVEEKVTKPVTCQCSQSPVDKMVVTPKVILVTLCQYIAKGETLNSQMRLAEREETPTRLWRKNTRRSCLRTQDLRDR